jgi:hypothetical protein
MSTPSAQQHSSNEKAARQSAAKSHSGPRNGASGFAASDFDGPVCGGAGDSIVHADRVCDWKPGEIPQRDAQAHVTIQISGHMDHDAVWQNNPENAAAGVDCI